MLHKPKYNNTRKNIIDSIQISLKISEFNVKYSTIQLFNKLPIRIRFFQKF